jgi:hypothetical protein
MVEAAWGAPSSSWEDRENGDLILIFSGLSCSVRFRGNVLVEYPANAN